MLLSGLNQRSIHSHNKANMDAFTVTATVASRGYHVCETITWINSKVGDKVI